MKIFLTTTLLFLIYTCIGCEKNKLPSNHVSKLLTVKEKTLLAYSDNGVIYNSRHQAIACYHQDTLTNNQKQILGYVIDGVVFNRISQKIGIIEDNNIKNTQNQTVAIVEGHLKNDNAILGILMFTHFL